MLKNRQSVDILLFGFFLTLISSFGQTFFISLFSQPIRVSLSLSNFEFSAVYSGATLLSAVALSWTGQAIDKLPLERVTAFSLAGLFAGALALSFAERHVAILFAALFCLRQFGQGMLALLSATTMSRGFQGSRGKALSLSTLGHPVGEALLPSIAVALLLTHGLRHTWTLITVGLGVVSVLLVLVSYRISTHQKVKKNQKKGPQETGKQWSRQEVVQDVYFWALLPMLITAPFVITGLFFHQTLIAQSKQWPVSLFAASFSVYALAQVTSSLAAGALVDRWNARKILRYTLIPLLLACLTLAASGSTLALWAFMGFCGLSTGAMFPSTMAALTEVYGIRHIGSVKSVVASSLIFSTAISPPIVGWFLDQGANIERISMFLGLGVFITLTMGNLSLTKINQRLTRSTVSQGQ